MIGWSTRWPIAPTGPGDLDVRLPAHRRVRVVAGEMELRLHVQHRADAVALRVELRELGLRSSTLSKSIVIRRPPSPSGIFTFARQCRSSWTSKPSTPGISCAICAGSFSTVQTISRGAANSFVPSDLHVETTFTLARVDSGSCSIDQTRCDGLQLS